VHQRFAIQHWIDRAAPKRNNSCSVADGRFRRLHCWTKHRTWAKHGSRNDNHSRINTNSGHRSARDYKSSSWNRRTDARDGNSDAGNRSSISGNDDARNNPEHKPNSRDSSNEPDSRDGTDQPNS
jgi:hypothetical protein